MLRAVSAEDAAEQWAAHDDQASAEHSIAGGAASRVVVQNFDTGEITRWKVTGEYVPSYSAAKICEVTGVACAQENSCGYSGLCQESRKVTP